ncbi:lipopolysaccharide-induced tumor necrosis factor-alpha factor homolog [Pecten maximus]|uniref:lipopolysaccharide-induced tumor necrosis factor-alpha factor homolog n=1 Tax=Pecten maximus TaxID=6579 RepID=UPI001458717D|nr:lipopolysaccharide-induced tumor necrosis factor-alpha factor homolog [Pecten maximus]
MSDDFLKVSVEDTPAPPPYPSAESSSNNQYPNESEQGGYSHGAPPPKSRPPDQGYGPTNPAYGPQSGGTTVIINQPRFVPPKDAFNEEPIRMKCDACHQEILTSIHYETGMMVYLISIVCCVLGLVAGCCLIPFCVNIFKDVIHSCPNCRHQLGVMRRM